jgi:hypothetical protein
MFLGETIFKQMQQLRELHKTKNPFGEERILTSIFLKVFSTYTVTCNIHAPFCPSQIESERRSFHFLQCGAMYRSCRSKVVIFLFRVFRKVFQSRNRPVPEHSYLRNQLSELQIHCDHD